MRLSATILVMAASLLAAAPDPLTQERWRHRIVLVFADHADDPALRHQRESLASVADGLRKRDVRVIEVLGDAASDGLDGAALRASFDAHGPGFRVVLVGKDGGPKLRQANRLTAAALFGTIDAMPMARAEAARRSAP